MARLRRQRLRRRRVSSRAARRATTRWSAAAAMTRSSAIPETTGSRDGAVTTASPAARARTAMFSASTVPRTPIRSPISIPTGGAGHFATGDARFYAAAGATGGHDSDDRVVFNSSSGQLYYDADGSGGG